MCCSRRFGPPVFFMLAAAACRTRHVVPPTPAPAAATVQPAPGSQTTATEPGTAGTGTPVSNANGREPSPYQVNKPASPGAAKKPPRPAAAPASTVGPAPAGSPAAATRPPKLGDVLSQDEVRRYSAAIDSSLSRAQASLNAIQNRQLTKDQQAELGQIRNFMQQAQGSRSSDPAGAKSLAQRAEVLARDLAASFR